MHPSDLSRCPYLLQDMGFSVQHHIRGYSGLFSGQRHIEAEHNRAQLVPEVGLILEDGKSLAILLLGPHPLLVVV